MVEPALCCLKALPAGDESREDRGDAPVEGERDTVRLCMLMPDREAKAGRVGLWSPFVFAGAAGCAFAAMSAG